MESDGGASLPHDESKWPAGWSRPTRPAKRNQSKNRVGEEETSIGIQPPSLSTPPILQRPASESIWSRPDVAEISFADSIWTKKWRRLVLRCVRLTGACRVDKVFNSFATIGRERITKPLARQWSRNRAVCRAIERRCFVGRLPKTW